MKQAVHINVLSTTMLTESVIREDKKIHLFMNQTSCISHQIVETVRMAQRDGKKRKEKEMRQMQETTLVKILL